MWRQHLRGVSLTTLAHFTGLVRVLYPTAREEEIEDLSLGFAQHAGDSVSTDAAVEFLSGRLLAKQVPPPLHNIINPHTHTHPHTYTHTHTHTHRANHVVSPFQTDSGSRRMNVRLSQYPSSSPGYDSRGWFERIGLARGSLRGVWV